MADPIAQALRAFADLLEAEAMARAEDRRLLHAKLDALIAALADIDCEPVALPREPELVPWMEAGPLLGGIKRTKIAQLIADGALPSVTIGRRRFVTRTAIEDFVEGLSGLI